MLLCCSLDIQDWFGLFATLCIIALAIIRLYFCVGLTIEQATDCNLLQRELEKFEREFRDLSLCYQNRYSSKILENELKECLATGVISKDQLSAEIEHLKQKQSKLTVAVQAAQAYLKIQLPCETIGLAVVTALTRNFSNIDSDTSLCLLKYFKNLSDYHCTTS